MTAEWSLYGRTIIVTGGSMGIGFACAEEIIARGGRPFLVSRGERDLAAAAERLRAGSVGWLAADVSDERAVTKIFDAASARGRVDGVVHAAGIYGPIGLAIDIEPSAWLETIRVNLFGTFLVAREACRRMVAERVPGSIVLLAGGGGASPFPRYTAYAASKVAVVRFTETLALEMEEHAIRVNCIAPGFVATRLHDQTLAAGEAAAGNFLANTKAQLAKGGVPASVAARAAAFLLSPAASGISGRFVAAAYDDWVRWPDRLEEISGTDLFTLRRIVPRDRGRNWQ